MSTAAVATIVSAVAGPIRDLIDSLFTSDEERTKAKAALAVAEAKAEVEASRVYAEVVQTEMKGESTVQRTWRPHMMYVIISAFAWNWIVAPLLTWLTSLGLTVALTSGWLEATMYATLLDATKVPTTAIPDYAWIFLTGGAAGYVGLRSLVDKGGLEKIRNGKKPKENS